MFALAMPRGSGKTTLIVCAVIWAIVTGRRRYVALIGPTLKHATKMLRTIKMELRCNDRLAELYPEACYAIRKLGGQANKANGQKINGEFTHIEWTKTTVVMATVPDAKCSGAVIEVVGITGSVRGMQHTTPFGETWRPDLVVIDDPQTKRSAKSDTQCSDRLETIQGDVLGLAGPGEEISGFVLCTVIKKGDACDQLLDTEEHPEWQGERFQMVYDWPTNEDLWDKYATILHEALAAGDGMGAATTYYRKHRKKMDAGCKVGWPSRFKKGELSAIQHAYNLLLQDETAFWCEYQNEPRDDSEDTELLTVAQIMAKQSGYVRGTVHPEADVLTAFTDVQGKCLYWCVIAWRSSDFSGWIVDYGAWPDQGVPHFTLRQVRKTMAKAYPGLGEEGRIKAALVKCIDYLAGREFQTPDKKKSHRVRRIATDSRWAPSKKVVEAVVRTHDHASLLLASEGQGIKPSNAPMERWALKPGDRRGIKNIVRLLDGGGRKLMADVNWWKSFVHRRFSTADGDKGSLYVPKPRRRYKTEHKMLAEHQRAEDRDTSDERGDVWTEKKSKQDNHLFDCVVHCAVLASNEGVKLQEHGRKRKKKKRRRGYSGQLAT